MDKIFEMYCHKLIKTSADAIYFIQQLQSISISRKWFAIESSINANYHPICSSIMQLMWNNSWISNVSATMELQDNKSATCGIVWWMSMMAFIYNLINVEGENIITWAKSLAHCIAYVMNIDWYCLFVGIMEQRYLIKSNQILFATSSQHT